MSNDSQIALGAAESAAASASAAATSAEYAADQMAQFGGQGTIANQVANRIDGVTDHGSISGSLELDSDISTHWLDATGPTVLSFTDGPSGGTRYVSVLVASGAADVTVADLPDVTVTDGAFATFAWVRGAWILAGAGSGEPAIPDTTPPSAVTDLTATGGSLEIVLAWSVATDAESAVKYGWKVWKDGDTEPSSYTIRTTPGVTVTGLTPGDYHAKVYAFSAGGTTVADTATATVTAPALVIAEDFTGTDAANVTGRTPAGADGPFVVGADMANMGGAGTLKIVGNKAVSAGSGVNANKIPFTDGVTCILAVDYNFNGVTSGDIKVGLGDPGNHYYAQVGGSGNGFLLKGDVSYNSGAIAGQPSSGRLLLEVTATTVTAKVNGVTIATTARLGGAWSSPFAAIAIESSNTAITLDNMELTVS